MKPFPSIKQSHGHSQAKAERQQKNSFVSSPPGPSGGIGTKSVRPASGFHCGETQFYQPVQNLATSGHRRGKSCENED